MNPTLRFLDSVRDNLEAADYSLIYQSILEMRNKPVTTALLHKGHYIDRVRINYDENPFLTHEEISYIHDRAVIEKLDFGRANAKGKPMFYGSLMTPEIELPRAVAYLETTKRFKNGVLEEQYEETFTLSRWLILETIEIVEIAFSKDAIKKSSSVRDSYENQVMRIPKNEFYEDYLEQLAFFSDEFAKQKIYSPADYKISAAYAKYFWENSRYGGITYASVPTEYKGQNVCLLPKVVDKYLKLEKVAMFKAIRENNKGLFIGDCFKYCDNFGVNGMNFYWQDYKGGIIM